MMKNFATKFKLIFELSHVVWQGFWKRLFSYGQLPEFIFSIDCESRFINKTQLDPDSFDRDFIQGSRQIASILKNSNFRGCFFINISEYLYGDDYVKKNIAELIQDLQAKGHQLGIHIHPSLHPDLTSTDFSSYSQTQINEMLRDAKNAFIKITGSSPIVFRAGGYSVGEWSKVAEALIQNQIFIDSSVFPGSSNLHGAKFDFSQVEFSQPYRPSLNDYTKHDSTSPITEFPISTLKKPNSNLAASVMRFDPNRPLMQLKSMLSSMRSKEPRIVNFIYHSKEVFDKNGELHKSARNLQQLMEFLKIQNCRHTVYSELSTKS